ncbi:hypothetical protein HRI_004358600 [Hibiscus trionum]|uniref:Organ-specific protein P4 n=1 Tax=Hibiscus trionum TaxID=183268 RepID=A0A9W7MLU7_HIBTR|nr:hypothetical protein HRI_004358600 [Hibiscus trionum]
MQSFLPFFAFLSLLLFADTIAAARKDAGEYWRAVMKDQTIPEALEELARIEAASEDKTHCDTPAVFELKVEKLIVQDFGRKGTEKKSAFAEDFEPRPNISAYGDDENLKVKKLSSFAEDFEPRPNISAYGDDANLKGKESSSFAEDFEPRPNISAYGGDGDLKGKEKSFTSDFEQEPNISVYQD